MSTIVNSQPLVSILTPGYNVGKKASLLFDSLLSQTYSNIEFIFINDGSTDNTEELLFSYISMFRRKGINVIYRNQTNMGVCGAINTGLPLVSGEYLTWPDADDYLTPDSIEKKVSYLTKNKSIAIVTTDAFLFNEENLDKPIGKLADSYPNIREDYQFDYLLQEQSIFCPGCHMVRTKALRKSIPQMKIYESRLGQNYQILLPIYYQHKHGFINEPLFNYVIYKESISHAKTTSIFSELKRISLYEQTVLNTISTIKMEKHKYATYKYKVKKRFLKKKLNALAKRVGCKFDSI